MKNIFSIFVLAILSVMLSSSGCDKEKNEEQRTLKSLYDKYQNGEIRECSYKNEKAYSASTNAFDAETRIYDNDGKELGSCFYSTGAVDAVCNEVKDCEAIYRCQNHISGQPAIDKYGLSNK